MCSNNIHVIQGLGALQPHTQAFEKGEEKRLVHTVCACANFKSINYVMAYSDVAIGGWLT